MHRSAPHLLLLPSPTRRSSDLAAVALGRIAPEGGVREGDHLVGAEGAELIGAPPHRASREHQRVNRAAQGIPQATRSEEHTSELQSRQYIVCRLLLEKKNKI